MKFEELNNILIEGGAAMKASRINVENIKSTFDRYVKQVIKKVDPKAKYKTIGSLGKKDSSGDIDVALDTKLSLDQVCVKLTKLGIDFKISKGLKQIYTEFPIFNQDGSQTESMVQVDLMFGDIDFMSSTYWAPGESQSKYTGADLSVFFAGVTRFTKIDKIQNSENKKRWKEIQKEKNDPYLAYVYNINQGISLKARWKEESQRGKYKGQLKDKFERLPNVEAKTISEIISLWNSDSTVIWTKKDFALPLEKVWEKAKLGFTKNKIKDIIKYTESSLSNKKSLKEGKLGKRLFG